MSRKVGIKFYQLKNLLLNQRLESPLSMERQVTHCHCPRFLWFNGTDTCVQTNLCEPNLWRDALTVECRFRASADISGGCLVALKNTHGLIKLFILDGSVRVELRLFSTDQSTIVCTSNSTLRQFQWYHVAFTWDRSQDHGEVKIYLDGAQAMTLEGKRLWEAPLPLASLHMNELDNGSYTIGQGLSGFIQHVGIWRRALSIAEIVQHVGITRDDRNAYLSKVAATSESTATAETAIDMVAYWPLLDGEGQLARCESGITAHPIPPAEILRGSWHKEREKRFAGNETEQEATWPRNRPLPVPDANVTVVWEGRKIHYSAVSLGPATEGVGRIRQAGEGFGQGFFDSLRGRLDAPVSRRLLAAPVSRRRVLFVKQGTSNILLHFRFLQNWSYNRNDYCPGCVVQVYIGMRNGGSLYKFCDFNNLVYVYQSLSHQKCFIPYVGFSAGFISHGIRQQPASDFSCKFNIDQNHLPGPYYVTQQISLMYNFIKVTHENDFEHAIALVHVLPRAWRLLFSRLPFEIRQEIKIMLMIRARLRLVSDEAEDGNAETGAMEVIPAYGRVPNEVLHTVFERLIDAWCDM